MFSFGGSTAKPTNTFSFGASSQPASAPAVAAQAPPMQQGTESQAQIDRTTRYTELSKAQQDYLDGLDKKFGSQVQLAEDINARLPQVGEMAQSIPLDVEEVTRRVSRVATALEMDRGALTVLREQVDRDVSRFLISRKLVDTMRTPGAVIPRHANDPILAYISETCDEAEKTMATYSTGIQEMERYLKDLEDHVSEPHDPDALIKALESQQQLFLLLSNKVAQAHDEFKRVQSNLSRRH